MRIGKSVSSRGMSGRIKEATDTILGTGADTADSMFDSRSGALLTFLLLFIVGWIPTFGQMIAGYVGGRRSGSPYRGFFATSIATVCVLVILTLIAFFLDSINGALITDSQVQLDRLREQSPILADFAAPAVDYLKAMFGGASLSVAYASYAITPVFGVIGGVVSNQMQKEIRYIIHSAGKAPGQHVRSLDLHRSGKPMGFTYSQVSSSFSVNANASPAFTPVQHVSEVRPQADIASPVRTVDTTVGIRSEESYAKRTDSVNPFENIPPKKKRADPIAGGTPTSNMSAESPVRDTVSDVTVSPETSVSDEIIPEAVSEFAVPVTEKSDRTEDDSESDSRYYL